MHPLLKNTRVIILIIALLLAVSVILWKGIKLGVEFTGGSVLFFQFDRPLSPEERANAINILSHRLDWAGLSGTVVRAWGDRYVIVEISASDRAEVERVKESILKQGRFEAVVDGKVVLTGEDIATVYPPRIVPSDFGAVREVPFVLTPEGEERFFQGVKGKCPTENNCAYVYMYFDRPAGWVLLIPKRLYMENVPIDPRGETRTARPIKEFLTNAGVIWFVVDENFDANVLKEYNRFIVPPELKDLPPKGATIRVVPERNDYNWLWAATNLRSIVRLRPEVTFRKTSQLIIRIWAPTPEKADRDAKDIEVLLKSGALPANLSLVSEGIIPPQYGLSAFYTFLAALILAMFAISAYVSFLYKEKRIALPIIMTIFSEILMIFGFAALVGWRLDVASMVGMITAVGTGVDDQIVITDEVLRGEAEEEKKHKSILGRIKKAFFVVFATAFALGSAMLPVLFSGITSLAGFAITTLVGIFVGVLITRPAFAEVLRYVLRKE